MTASVKTDQTDSWQKDRQRCNSVLNWSAVICTKVKVKRRTWVYDCPLTRGGLLVVLLPKTACVWQSSWAIMQYLKTVVVDIMVGFGNYQIVGNAFCLETLNALNWRTVETDLALSAATTGWKNSRDTLLSRGTFNSPHLSHTRPAPLSILLTIQNHILKLEPVNNETVTGREEVGKVQLDPEGIEN